MDFAGNQPVADLTFIRPPQLVQLPHQYQGSINFNTAKTNCPIGMYFLTHPQGADQCIDAKMRKWPQVGMYCYYLHTIATTDILLLILTYYCYYWHITAATGILLLLLVYYWTIYWNISSYPVAQDSGLFRICEEIFIFGETFTSVLTYFYCYYRHNSPMFPMIMEPGFWWVIRYRSSWILGVTTLFQINHH